MPQLVFLPGASGNLDFWTPLIECLPKNIEKKIIGYPGFGAIAEDPQLKGFDDLQHYVTAQINTESVVIAQSMGGIFAIHKALTDPHLVKGLVLIATSGGVDLSPFDIQDWRDEYQQHYPRYPAWFMTTTVNYDEHLNKVNIPTLLIWGDADPISPIAVGTYLNTKLKCSILKIIRKGKHHLAQMHAKEVSIYINQFLETISCS